MRLNRNRRRCTRVVQWRKVINDLPHVGDEKPSLRQMTQALNEWAKERGCKPCLTHADVARLLAGAKPRDKDKRRALGLLPVVRPPRRIWERCALDVWRIVWGERKPA